MKNQNKNLIEAGAILAIVLLVFAYGFLYPRMHPEKTVTKFLNAVTSFNSTRVANNYAGTVEDFDFMTLILEYEDPSETAADELSEEEQEQNKDFSAMLYEFDYDIGSHTINGKTATVDVTIHAYPIGETYLETNGDRAALLELKQSEKSYSTETTFSLIMENGYWYVESLTDENKDALSGGLYHILSAMLDTQNDTSQEE